MSISVLAFLIVVLSGFRHVSFDFTMQYNGLNADRLADEFRIRVFNSRQTRI